MNSMQLTYHWWNIHIVTLLSVSYCSCTGFASLFIAGTLEIHHLRGYSWNKREIILFGLAVSEDTKKINSLGCFKQKSEDRHTVWQNAQYRSAVMPLFAVMNTSTRKAGKDVQDNVVHLVLKHEKTAMKIS